MDGVRSIVVIALGLLFAFGLPEVDAASPLSMTDGKSLLAGNSFSLVGEQKELGSLQQIAVTGQSFATAMRVSTLRQPTTEWNLQLKSETATDIKAGDVVLAHFWIRAVESMTGEAFTGFEFELGPPAYAKIAELRAGAGHEWRECNVPFKAARDIPAEAAGVCFRCGFDRQTIDIGGVEIVDFGSRVKLEDLPRTRDTYAGRQADAPWRKQAMDRIEKIRKADLLVTVTDGSGKPIPDAAVHIEQKRHAFRFGSCVTVDLLLGESADAEKYRQIVESDFNQAVFENDMKWPAVAGGIPPRLDLALKWLLDRKIAVRGHNLIWQDRRYLPESVLALGNNLPALRELADRHITEEVSHFRGKLIQWDVVNEPYTNHYLTDLLGQGVIIDWYKLAREADPSCKLYLNDFGIVDGGGLDAKHQDNFYSNIQYLKDSGAPIDGIGIQSHFGGILTDPARVLQIFDRYSQLGLPIESTELSINSDDAELQSDYLRDYMTAAFSHPNVHGIMLWGFWEKRHWRPLSALFDAHWNLRPIGKAWVDLVRKQWWTNATATTDANGLVSVRGFLGDYEITVMAGGKTKVITATLESRGSKVRTTME
jgi:GH35 family endo-1,4-beta-xylanase